MCCAFSLSRAMTKTDGGACTHQPCFALPNGDRVVGAVPSDKGLRCDVAALHLEQHSTPRGAVDLACQPLAAPPPSRVQGLRRDGSADERRQTA